MSNFDYNKLSHTFKKYWDIAYCDNIECAICKDRQLFMFHIEDIKQILVNNYEYDKHNKSFWWNNSKDRYIAEFITPELVTVNPQFCYRHIKEIIS